VLAGFGPPTAPQTPPLSSGCGGAAFAPRGGPPRAPEAAFGNVITDGHPANGDGYKGREVYWSLDEFGLVLAGFTPVEDGSPALAG